jgi:hypothetical protein
VDPVSAGVDLADLNALIRADEPAVMRALAERIAGNAAPDDPRLEVADAIARYLKLDWPAARGETGVSAKAVTPDFTIDGYEWVVLEGGRAIDADSHEKAVAALGGTWHMPDLFELQYKSPLDRKLYNPAFDAAKYPMLRAGWYRSSEAAGWAPESAAWGVGFSLGLVGYYFRRGDGFALAVRRVGQ